MDLLTVEAVVYASGSAALIVFLGLVALKERRDRNKWVAESVKAFQKAYEDHLRGDPKHESEKQD